MCLCLMPLDWFCQCYCPDAVNITVTLLYQREVNKNVLKCNCSFLMQWIFISAASVWNIYAFLSFEMLKMSFAMQVYNYTSLECFIGVGTCVFPPAFLQKHGGRSGNSHTLQVNIWYVAIVWTRHEDCFLVWFFFFFYGHVTWALFKYSQPGLERAEGSAHRAVRGFPSSWIMNVQSSQYFSIVLFPGWEKKTHKWKLFSESYETGWHCFGVLADNIIPNCTFKSISATKGKKKSFFGKL